MTSASRIEANRRNAQKSTGPKTAEGKAASSGNALRHGLTAQKLILFDETEAAFAQFHDELRAAHAPADAAEAALVERIAVAHWRLRRVWRVEAAWINGGARDAQRRKVRAALAKEIAAQLEAKPPEGPEGKLTTPEEAAQLAIVGLRELPDEVVDEMIREDEESGREPSPSLAEFPVWPQRLAELQRHEASLERTLSRLARDLERAQTLRRERLAEAHAADVAELQAEGRALAIRRKLEAETPEAELAKRSQPSILGSLAPRGEGRGEGAAGRMPPGLAQPATPPHPALSPVARGFAPRRRGRGGRR